MTRTKIMAARLASVAWTAIVRRIWAPIGKALLSVSRESTTCVAVSFGFTRLFRERRDSQGRVAKLLSENAFSVYVFHPPMVILVARTMHGLLWPPLLKFGLLSMTSTILIFGLSAALRQVLLSCGYKNSPKVLPKIRTSYS